MNTREGFRRIGLACVAAFWVAACSDDTTEGPTDGSADVNSPDVKRETTTADTSRPDAQRPDATSEAGVCAPLALPCDGPEDCPAGNHCCGALTGLTYTQVSCQPTCLSADAGGASDAGLGGLGAGLTLELCHAGDTCEDSTTQCSSSAYLPMYLYRCYTMGAAVPATATGGAGVHCGSATCGAGEECCLREPSTAYCAPKGQACSCDGPAVTDSGSDADATSVETGADASPEASDAAPEASEASSDATSEAAEDAAGDAPANE